MSLSSANSWDRQALEPPVAVARKRLLFLSSRHLGWTALRSIVHEQEHLSMVPDPVRLDLARDTAIRQQPDAIVLAADLPGHSVVTMVTSLQQEPCASKIVVLGEDLPRDTLVALRTLGVQGLLDWRDLHERDLLGCLMTAVMTDLHVVSRTVTRTLTRTSAPVTPAAEWAGSGITPRERAVLRGLGAGLSEEQIAEQEHVGHRTVERTVRELKRKLEAPNLAVLALRARDLGLLE